MYFDFKYILKQDFDFDFKSMVLCKCHPTNRHLSPPKWLRTWWT